MTFPVSHPFAQQSIPLSLAANGEYTEGPWFISDADDSADPRYYMYRSGSGDWYILKQLVLLNQYRYCCGAGSADTAWTNRASQTYTTPDIAFRRK